MTVSSQPPYVGPRAFMRGEKIHGRDREAAELLDLLTSQRVVLFYSPSGAGKTSLVNAAIIDEMVRRGFDVLPHIRVNQIPPASEKLGPDFNRYVFSALLSMESGFTHLKQLPEEQLYDLDFSNYLRTYIHERAAYNKDLDELPRILLIFDQLEEIFDYDPTDRDARHEFFAQIGEVLRKDNIWALFVIREEFIAALDPYLKHIPTRFNSRFRLDLLEADDAIEAIRKPAESAGRSFDLDAAQRLVDDLCRVDLQGPDGVTVERNGLFVDPLQLQIVCLRLWNQLSPNVERISINDVGKIGDADTVLAEYYDEEVAKAASKAGVSESAIREWFERKLIRPDDLRGQIPMEPDDKITTIPNEAIRLLCDAHLARKEKRGETVWHELSHDRLIQPIRASNKKWFEKNLSLFQRLADLWNRQNRVDGLLLRGAAYKDAVAWAEEHAGTLLPHEKDFLHECRAGYRADQRQRFLNTALLWFGIVAVIGSILALVFYFRAQEAETTALDSAQKAKQSEEIASRSEQIMLARQLAAQSFNKLDVNPAFSVRDALEAISKVTPPIPEAQDALRRALPALRVEQNLIGHRGDVRAVAFSPDGKTLASVGSDGTLRIWDLVNSKGFSSGPMKTIQVIPASDVLGYGVTSVAFNPSRGSLAVGTERGEIIFYETSKYAETGRISAHDRPIMSLAYSPDGKHIVSASKDKTANVWDVQSRAKVITLLGHEDGVNAVAYSPDGKQIVTASDDRTARIWDAETGKLSITLNGHSGSVEAVVYSRDGSHIATAGADRTIRIWNPTDGTEQLRITGHRDLIYGLAFTLDGSTIISTSADHTIRFWDTTYGRSKLILPGHVDQVFAVALSPSGKRLASASADGNVLLWNIAADGSRELFTVPTVARLYDVDYNFDGSRIVTAGEDGKVRLWDSNGRSILTLNGHTDAAEAVAFSPDGSLIASASLDKTARLWDANTGEQKLSFDGHTDAIYDIGFSPDGKNVATASKDGTVKIWDAATGKVIHTLRAEGSQFISLAFSPDGRSIVAGNSDGEVILWNLTSSSSSNAGTWLIHQGAVEALAFSPDGSLLATVGDDGVANLLDATNNMSPRSQFRETGGALFSVTFSPDGKSLLVGGADGIAHIFDVDQVKPTVNLYGNTDSIYGVAFNPDASRVVTVGGDNTLRGFVTSLNELIGLANERIASSITPQQCAELSQNCPQVAPLPTATSVQVAVTAVPPREPSLNPASEIDDAVSADVTSTHRVPAGSDDFKNNLFERPVDAGAMDVYYPEIDIKRASLIVEPEWMYFTIQLNGTSLDGSYGIELDLNNDGRGDMLIAASEPQADWSTEGVRVWQDSNSDVGNGLPVISDPPQLGDGYDVLVFDQGIGSSADLAWARVSPRNPASVQIAIKRALINNDDIFLWDAWASRDALKPAWFDYNDHFTAEEAGSPDSGSDFYPLKSLSAMDNTCRRALGFTPGSDEPGVCRKP